MVDIDLGAMTIPVFVSIFGMGWGACYSVLVSPMKERLTSLETRLAEIEAHKDDRIRALETKLGLV